LKSEEKSEKGRLPKGEAQKVGSSLRTKLIVKSTSDAYASGGTRLSNVKGEKNRRERKGRKDKKKKKKRESDSQLLSRVS